MRYHEIGHEHPAIRQNTFNVVTLFVPKGQVDAFIATCEQPCCKIIQTRVLARFGGYSVDVLTDNPDVAASLFGDWVSRSGTIAATVKSGTTVLDTLSDLIAGEGER